MVWIILSLLAGWTYCIQSELNKHFKINGFHLNAFRSLFAVVILIPFIPFMEFPNIPEYYLVIILEGAVAVVGMMVQYNLAAKHNGRISSLHQPIAIILTFVFWLLIDVDQRIALLNNPTASFGILAAFILFTVSLNYIRKGDIGIEILLSVIPVAILYSLMSVISKIALAHGEGLFAISLSFVLLSNISMLLISIPVLIGQKMNSSKLIIDRKLLKASVLVAFSHTISWVLICAAIILTPNPAYPAFITGLAPLWFMLYYKIKGVSDDANPIAGLFLAISSLMLVFFTY